MNTVFTLTPGVAIIIRRDDHILLLRRSAAISAAGFYTLVGGHVDGNETIRQAAVREAHEEAGIIIDPNNLQFINVMHRRMENTGRELVLFTFETTVWQGEPYNKEPEKHDVLDWFHVNTLPEPLFPPTKHVFSNLKKQFYSEHGW